MSPIAEDVIKAQKVELERGSIKNKIGGNKQKLELTLQRFERQTAADNTNLIEEYLQKLSDELNKKIQGSENNKSSFLKLLNEKARDFNKKEQEIKDALPALEESSRQVREMIPQWREAIADGKVDEAFVNNMYDKFAVPDLLPVN